METIPYLVGQKIYLALFTRQHLEDSRYQRWLNNLETTSNLGMLEYVMPVSFEQLEAYYTRNAFSGHSVLFAVHVKETDEFIGTTKVGPIHWIPRCAEFGRMIGTPSARGKGYGTEIIVLILEYCFRTLNLNKVTAGALANNIAALRSQEKCGLKIEGRIRQAWFKDGEMADAIRVGILREEWEAWVKS